MLFEGQFKNIQDETITVYIRTDEEGDNVTINEDDSEIFFANDPVEISTEIDDTFSVIISAECTIKLLVKNYLGDSLFPGGARSVVVNVYKNSTCIFAGFCVPGEYSQPYNKELNEITLTCGDLLSTLQYYRYENLITKDDYEDYKASADNKTFTSILYNILRVAPDMDLYTHQANRFYYDGSVRLSSSSDALSVFDEVQIPELLFLGDEVDDVYTHEEILTQILQYYDLHIIQLGTSFYIFSWSTIKQGAAVTFYPFLIPDVYTVIDTTYQVASRAKSSYVAYDSLSSGELPRETLQNSVTGSEIKGNQLQLVWSDEPEMIRILVDG